MSYIDLVYTGEKAATKAFEKEAVVAFPGINTSVSWDEIHEYRVEVTGEMEPEDFWRWAIKEGWGRECLRLRLEASDKGVEWLKSLLPPSKTADAAEEE